MRRNGSCDALVVGAGPNGLSAGIAIAQAGRSVLVLEGRDTVGGGARSAALTLPGFLHDVCSAVHPLAVGSPFLSTLPLSDHGLEWVQPPAPLAHPLDDGTAVTLERSVEATAAGLGPDAASYRGLFGPLARDWCKLTADVLGPLRVPRHPLVTARFGLAGLRSARSVAEARFRGERARALFAGLAGHSMLPLERPLSAAFGLVLGAAGHAVGWPMPRGGSRRIAEALASHLASLGGRVDTGVPVESLDDLPAAAVTLLDVTPRQVIRIAGRRLRGSFRRRLEAYRYGPGAFKMDWALSGPVPWRASECARAGTLHLGGTMDEIAHAEREVWRGRHPERPFVLLSQPSLFDPSRAPEGRHTAWAYCHVPNGSGFDMTDRIEAQVGAFRAGVPRAGPEEKRSAAGGFGGVQSELRRRRHQRGRPGPGPALLPSRSDAQPLLHTVERHLHMLLVDAARRRRARHVRLLCRPRRPPPPRPLTYRWGRIGWWTESLDSPAGLGITMALRRPMRR